MTMDSVLKKLKTIIWKRSKKNLNALKREKVIRNITEELEISSDSGEE